MMGLADRPGTAVLPKCSSPVIKDGSSVARNRLASSWREACSRLADGWASSRTRASCQIGRSSMLDFSDGLSFLNDDKVRTFLLSSLTVTSVPLIENLSFTMYSANDLYPAASCVQDSFTGGPQR